MFSGKEKCICRLLCIDHDEFLRRGVRDVERLVDGATDIEALAVELSKKDIVIASETGSGVIPTDEKQLVQREQAGRLAQRLAASADVVVRVICGIPQVIKGDI